MELERLVEVNEETVSDVNILLKQLSERLQGCSLESLKEIIENTYAELWAARDGERIVGIGMLAVITAPEGLKGKIEDVVVHSDYRGQGLGQQLLAKLIERAQDRGIAVLELTSREERVAANSLYLKAGFIKTETNVYRMKF